MSRVQAKQEWLTKVVCYRNHFETRVLLYYPFVVITNKRLWHTSQLTLPHCAELMSVSDVTNYEKRSMP